MKKLFLIILLLPMNVQAFTTSAVSSILMDTDSGRVLYAKNPHHIQSVASISKIMTAIIVIENSNLYDTVVVSKKAASTGGSTLGIKEGDKK